MVDNIRVQLSGLPSEHDTPHAGIDLLCMEALRLHHPQALHPSRLLLFQHILIWLHCCQLELILLLLTVYDEKLHLGLSPITSYLPA